MAGRTGANVGRRSPVGPSGVAHADPPHEDGALRCVHCGRPDGKRSVVPSVWAFADRFWVELPTCQPCRDTATRENDPDECFACNVHEGPVRVYVGVLAYVSAHQDLGLCEPCIRIAANRDRSADIASLEAA